MLGTPLSVMMLLFTLMSIQSVRAASWTDFLPALKPYQDPSGLKLEEESGTARLGFVQLNSGSTSFNTTLNLTGPILLGLGIAAATLFYAYFNAFQSGSGYNRYKRSAADSPLSTTTTSNILSVLDSITLVHTLEDSLSLIGLKSPSCKLRAVCEIHKNGHRVPGVNTVEEVVRMVVERLRKGDEDEMWSGWMKAAEKGWRGEECGEIYKECDGENFEKKLLQQVNSF